MITWLQYFSASDLLLSACQVSLNNFLPILPYLPYMAIHSFLTIFLHCHMRYHSFATVTNCLRKSAYKQKGFIFSCLFKKVADHNQADVLLLGICSGYEITFRYLLGARSMWESKTTYSSLRKQRRVRMELGSHNSIQVNSHRDSFSYRLHHLPKVQGTKSLR